MKTSTYICFLQNEVMEGELVENKQIDTITIYNVIFFLLINKQLDHLKYIFIYQYS